MFNKVEKRAINDIRFIENHTYASIDISSGYLDDPDIYTDRFYLDIKLLSDFAYRSWVFNEFKKLGIREQAAKVILAKVALGAW